jgi:predicted MFS family arabinose efflux permease
MVILPPGQAPAPAPYPPSPVPHPPAVQAYPQAAPVYPPAAPAYLPAAFAYPQAASVYPQTASAYPPAAPAGSPAPQADAALAYQPAPGPQAPAPYQPQAYSYPPAPNGYGHPSAPNGYGHPSAPNGYGHPSAPNGYGHPSAPNGYGHPSAPNGYGHPSAPNGYGQAPAWGGPAAAPPVAVPAAATDGWSPRTRMAVGWMTLFLIGTDLFVISPLLPVVSERYQIDVTTAGWTLTSFSFAYMLAAPVLGGLSDKHGRRRVMVAGLLAFGIANFLTSVIAGLTDSFVALVLTRAAAGFSAAAITPSVYAATGDMAPPARRASWLAAVGSGLLIALALGAPLGGLIAAVLGMRSVFTIIALACFALAALNARAWPSGVAPAPAPPPGAAGAGPPQPITAFLLVRAVGPTVLWSASLFGAYTYLGGGLAAAANATAADTALIIVFFGIGMVAGNLTGGRAADRFGSESVMSAAYMGLGFCWLAVARLVLGGHPDASRLPLVGIGFALASYLAQLFFPAQQARLARIFAARRAAALSWNNSALYLGMSVGSALGGTILRRHGFPDLLNTLAILAFSSALLLSGTSWAAHSRAARRAFLKP